MFTEKSLFLTINNKTLRLVITSRAGIGGMVYTRDYDASDLVSGFYSYCMYENCFSEDEVKTLIDLYEEGKKIKVINQIKKRLSMPDVQKKKVGPMGEMRLKDLVPDDWFDGCGTLLDLLEYRQVVGIFEQDIQEYGIDYM